MSWGWEARVGGMHRVSGSEDLHLCTAHCVPVSGPPSRFRGPLAVFLAPAVGAGGVGVIAAVDGASAALVDGLELVLDLGQPTAEVGVLRLQVGDPLLQGGDEGQDGGLGLGWDRVPERCGGRWWRDHALSY